MDGGMGLSSSFKLSAVDYYENHYVDCNVDCAG